MKILFSLRKIKSILFLVVILSFFPILTLGAENVSVSPLLIDYETEARDIVVKDVKVKNNGTVPVRLFASVHEIELNDSDEIKSFVPPSMSDRTLSITSWIEISRAQINLLPGEEKILPLTIRINPNAKPGEYHGLVGFGSGKNRDIAEKKVRTGEAGRVLVRVSIDEKQIEMLRLSSFKTERIVYKETGDNEFAFTLQNVGDVPLTPEGEIVIYNSKGEEITALSVNEKQTQIAPGEKVSFKEKIPFTNNVGKNKAFLNLQYGKNNLASVQDTNFYYSLPLPLLLALGVLLLIIPLVLTLILRKSLVHSSQEGIDENEASDLPLFVRNSHEHDSYDHDIDLKKKD